MEAAARLIVDVPRLRSGGERFQGEVPAEALELDASTAEFFQPDGGIRYDMTVEIVGEELLGRGAARMRFHAVCSRCATAFDLEVADRDIITATPLAELPEFVDLTPELREAIILALPGYPVCRDDCRGLCPRCGANLNEGPCGCGPEGDDRWHALEGLDR